MPAPSSQGYKINIIGGANDMMAGTGTELAVECPDDYTLVVNLDAPYGDFLMQVCDPSTAPVPAGCADTDEDYQKFRVSPIGNGPFKMNGEWVDGQYIPLVRNDDYWGEKPFIDGVTFIDLLERPDRLDRVPGRQPRLHPGPVRRVRPVPPDVRRGARRTATWPIPTTATSAVARLDLLHPVQQQG